MPRGALYTHQDCDDFLRGCLWMGTGGAAGCWNGPCRTG